jgi:hypothetical protein
VGRSPEIPEELQKLGVTEWPTLPCEPEELLGTEDDAAAPVVRWGQREGLKVCLDDGPVFGVGAAITEKGETAVGFLVDADRPATGIPTDVPIEGRRYPVRAFPVPRTMAFNQAFARQTGARTGSAIGNGDAGRRREAGGTLSGIFPGPGGAPWAMTCAHVALGWGFLEFISNLPASLLWLFQSPRGEELVVSAAAFIGQDQFRLAEVDTTISVLQPLPLALATGVLATIYVDVAAGPVNVQPFQPNPLFFPPPAPPPTPIRQTVQGTPVEPSRNARAGEEIYGYGQELGLRWGRVIISGLTLPLPLPIPLLGVPVIVVFNLDVYDMRIAPGDSGMTALAMSDNRALSVCGLGLGGTPANPINRLTLGTPRRLIRRFIPNVDI